MNQAAGTWKGFFSLLLCLFACIGYSIPAKHHIALLLGDSCKFRFDFRHIGPAVDIAINRSLVDYNVEFVLHRGNYSCEKHTFVEAAALGKASDFHQRLGDSLTAFIGPAVSNDVKVVGTLATYRSIPLITGLGDVISQRDRYNTLIRLSHDGKFVASAILAFLKKFEWKKFGLIYRLGDVWYTTVKRDLEKQVKMSESVNNTDWTYEITCSESYVRNYKKEIVGDVKAMLERMRLCSRIIVILGGDREVRKFLLEAFNLGMIQTNEFAFLYPELMQHEAVGNISWAKGAKYTPSELQKIKNAYRALLIFSLNQPLSAEYLQFSDEVKKRALEVYDFVYDEKMVNYYTAAFYDGVILLAKVLNLTTQNSLMGLPLVDKIIKTKLKGVSGQIHLDNYGDRMADYALLDMMDEEQGDFEVVMEYYSSTKAVRVVRQMVWPGGKRPVDRPFCGFDNNDPACEKKKFPLLEIAITTICAVILICALTGILIFKKLKYEAELANMSWRISWDSLSSPSKGDAFNRQSVSRLTIRNGFMYNKVAASTEDFGKTAIYKGNMVAIKMIDRHKKVELSRTLLLQLKQMRDVQHENIARFIGVCLDVPHVCIITEYCPKGSLMDVLQNDSLKLDWMFRYSLINDIVKALAYLHGSEVGCHGRLTSKNCFVDNLFVLKVSDFGLPMLRAESYSYSITSMNADQLLWCAPELLREDYNPKQVTKKGDVYSFGVILQEIILRDNPYCMYSNQFSSSEIIEKVMKQDNPRFRPRIEDWSCISELYNLTVRCWAEEPDQRPDFYQIADMMKGINRASDGSGNIMDDLLRRMEQYANNLEALVEQRTKAFLEEKRKSEELLYCVLPKSVADQLKTGMSVVPEMYDSVTIFFSDIVGFTLMCTQSSPRQVVDFLNDLYTCFDNIINDFNVYKVETIGDAYMVVSGLPERNGKLHAKEIARMALLLLKSIQNFHIRHQPDSTLNLRIGMHTGSCCAGVVGKTMPRYCLFGDTVNTASRMEATGLPHHIHVSSDTKTVLDSFGTFVLDPRGEIEVKGKGKMFTYWLVDETKKVDSSSSVGS